MYDIDQYYKKINSDECDCSNWFEVWMSLQRDLYTSEFVNEDVLLTTNSLTFSQRQQFIEWFPTFTHHIIWVTSPKEKCIEGNNARRRHVPIDLAVIYKAKNQNEAKNIFYELINFLNNVEYNILNNNTIFVKISIGEFFPDLGCSRHYEFE